MTGLNEYLTTQSPGELIQVTFETASNFNRESEPFTKALTLVLFLSFASEVENENDEFDVKSLGYFPSAHLPEDSPLLVLAKTSKFAAGLGDKLEHLTFHTGGKFTVELVLGCGKKSEFGLPDLYGLTKTVAETAAKHKVEKAVFVLEDLESDFLEGVLTGTFVHLSVDNRFKKDGKHEYDLKEVHVFHSDKDVKDTATRSKALSSGTHLTRELVTTPPNHATTVLLSEFVKKHFGDLGLEVKVLEEEDCKTQNMGAFLAVGQGSAHPPKFLHATYKGDGEVKKRVALVGKGILFDSGGYNVKSAATHIHMMKFDMGGMATVFGAAKAIAELKPKGVEVHFISATCENMVDANSYRPGDVVTASNGKTIEVVNTDAEGRMSLADALHYACNLGVDVVLDTATLTGAQIVALGLQYSAFFASDDVVAEQFSKAAKKSGEFSWRLPLVKEYKEVLKSKVADLANYHDETAGSITAALFLQEFVDKTPWVHVDIAGPAFDAESGRGTGYLVRTLTNFVLEFSDL